MTEFTLTEIEKACGVTKANAARIADRAYYSADERTWVLDPVAPAIMFAAMRFLPEGSSFKFAGFNSAGYAVFA